MYDIGMIGLAVMGENLTLNIESRGFSVVGYDIDTNRMTTFEQGRAKGKQIGFASSLSDLVSKLKSPRTIMIMIRAGKPVDMVVSDLIPLLDKGDIIIDGGNSYFENTNRRVTFANDHGIHYIGSGVSGGEEGALHGPSLMPGGTKEAWTTVQPIFEAIAAKTESNDVCTTWIGPAGSGHYVKMVHNGIEYADIQLITEVYSILTHMLNMEPSDIANVFEEWNKGELNSYLIEITVNILRKKDSDGSPLLNNILDTAGQKGTGKWTLVPALKKGVPISMIAQSVIARLVSAKKEERVHASTLFPRDFVPYEGDKESFLTHLKDALYMAKLLSYAQGFSLLSEASKQYEWNLDLASIASIWRGGCIIRSVFLYDIMNSYKTNPALSNLILDPFFQKAIKSRVGSMRHVVATAISSGIAIPVLTTGMSYFDGITTNRLPANLLQAMRDYFGAHTYERTDQPRGSFFHTDWTGQGGSTSSTTYDV